MTTMKPRKFYRPLEWIAKKLLFFLSTKKRIMCNNYICRNYADRSIVIVDSDEYRKDFLGEVRYYCKRCLRIIQERGYFQ